MVTKAELQTRVTQLEVENENLTKTVELVRMQRDNAKTSITEREEEIEELQNSVSEFKAERQKLITERDDIQCFFNAAHEKCEAIKKDRDSQLQQWSERYNECHAELIEASKKLNDANNTVESLNRVLERFDRDFNKAIAACHQHLIVSLDLPTAKPECEVCETSRFIYYLLGVLNGK